MKRRMKIRDAMRGAAAVAALFFGLAEAAFAQTEKPAGGQQEGLKVHGHWTIDIKNPDGTLLRRHEFQNALEPAGGLKLANFLARRSAPGLWSVYLYSPSGTPACHPGSAACVLSEDRELNFAIGALTVDVPTSGPNQGRLVLTGSFNSPDGRSFFRALSGVSECAIGSPGCLTGGNLQFTMKDFAPIPPVQAGQIVQVTVVIFFSSGP